MTPLVEDFTGIRERLRAIQTDEGRLPAQQPSATSPAASGSSEVTWGYLWGSPVELASSPIGEENQD